MGCKEAVDRYEWNWYAPSMLWLCCKGGQQHDTGQECMLGWTQPDGTRNK
jgi:hypothetical protein